MSKTIQLINKYRALIQDYIKNQKELPSPHDVLFHILNNYQDGSTSVLGAISNFFSPPKYTNFARNLSDALKRPNANILEVLNINLKKITLDKNEDLFALLIAYFYYYKNTYPILENYDELKKQIIIPLTFFRRRLLNDDVDFLLTLTQDENLCSEALRALEVMPIPAKKNNDVFVRLLNIVTRKYDLRTNNPSFACAVLRKCQIPAGGKDEFVARLLQQNDVRPNFEEFANDANCSGIFKILGQMNLPDSKREEVISMLFANVDDKNWVIREASWKTLSQLNPPPEMINTRLDKWIKDLDAKDFKTCDAAISRLATAPIPASHQEIAANKLLEKADNTTLKKYHLFDFELCTDEIRRGACLALGRMDVPSNLCEAVLNKLIERMNDGVYEAYEALNRQGIPENRTEEVISILLEQATTIKMQHDSLELLSKMTIPKTMLQVVIDKLFMILDTVPNCQVGQVFKVIAKLNLDDKTRKRVIESIFVYTKKEHNYYLYCYSALAQMRIPTLLKNYVLNKILEDLRDANSDIIPFMCRIQIDLNCSQKGLIIDILLNKLCSVRESYDASRIVDGICNILGRNSVHTEWSATLIKLEATLQKATIEQKPAVLLATHKFSNIVEGMRTLPQILPVEIKANIIHKAR